MAEDVRTKFDISSGPARNATALSPDDDTDLTYLTRGLYVGNGGDLAVILCDDTAPVIFYNVPTGAVLPLQIRRLMATDTDASNVIGLYNAE